MALFSDVLPSADNAARDINLLVSAMTVSQTIVCLVEGTALTWLEAQGYTRAESYSVVWIGTAAATCLAAPCLCFLPETSPAPLGSLMHAEIQENRSARWERRTRELDMPANLSPPERLKNGRDPHGLSGGL